jgi:hypothetical protein
MGLRKAIRRIAITVVLAASAVGYGCTPAWANPRTPMDCSEWVTQMLSVLQDKNIGVSLADELVKSTARIEACLRTGDACYLHNQTDVLIYADFVRAIYNVPEATEQGVKNAVMGKCLRALIPDTGLGKHEPLDS